MRVAIGVIGEARREILVREDRQMLLAAPAHSKLEVQHRVFDEYQYTLKPPVTEYACPCN